MAREVLDISYAKITVSYDFINESDSDITSPVTFPLPTYSATPEESGVIAHGEPSKFQVLVDGKTVPFDTLVRATQGSHDVTGDLKKIGLSEKQIALMPFDGNISDDQHNLLLPKPQIEALRNARLLYGDGSDAWSVPDWNVHVAYQWTQLFPAKKTVHIEHSYIPFVASGTNSGYFGSDPQRIQEMHDRKQRVVSDFCPSDATMKKLERLYADESKRDTYGEISGTIVDYILTTANTWKDGIRDFTLRIHKGGPDELVALCFPGAFQRTSDTVLEAHFQHFSPLVELSVYFANIKMSRLPTDNNGSTYGVAPKFRN